MAVFLRGSLGLASLCAALVIAPPARADAPAAACRVVNVDFTPGGIAASATGPEIDPQIVAWIEKPAVAPATVGEFVKTIYITQETGRFGIANRPGRFDFNSGPSWPYGRRVTVFPVWAHRHGLSWPQLEYQSGTDSDLSKMAGQSSTEVHFCRPLQASEPSWDAATCPSAVWTDKGKFGSQTSLYPPRADVLQVAGVDAPSVAQYKAMNPFDAISAATPRMGAATQITWPVPADVPAGDYVLYLEVSLEQDFNAFYSRDKVPPPKVAYGGYGVTYRGQPSVVYAVPFSVADDGATTASADAYVGSGDFDGTTGTLHPPDATITSDTPNSGALRLILTSKDGETFRVRVQARTEHDAIAPAAPGQLAVDPTPAAGVAVTFVAPGDDGMTGTATSYDVRYTAGDAPITDASFAQGNAVAFDGTAAPAGQAQHLTLKNLLPETTYTVAVRAYDNCGNAGPIASTTFVTPERASGTVDACFVATAAYGSLLANDVEMLRRFRDNLLKHSVIGELAVETYYTFGPPVAGVVGESDLLRATARELLGPIVDRVRGLRF
ncbi:MAG TPA: fibronectin type III domain-containing protein [Kofleriaceae bacterium]|nr:fibronectin type III domain-containing protein [Kofleriaceae bacterium]